MSHRIELEITGADCGLLIEAGIYGEGEVISRDQLAQTVAALFRAQLAQLAGRAGAAPAGHALSDLGITAAHARGCRDAVQGGACRVNHQARDWVGYLIAGQLGIPLAYGVPNDPADMARVKRILDALLEAGVLAIERRRDKNRKQHDYVIPGPTVPAEPLPREPAAAVASAECVPSAPAAMPPPPAPFMHLGRAQRPAAPTSGVRVLASGNPIEPNPPVFRHLAQAERVASAPSVRAGPENDGSIPVSTAYRTEERIGRAGPVEVLGVLWRRGH
jgi:hypothetical protein